MSRPISREKLIDALKDTIQRVKDSPRIREDLRIFAINIHTILIEQIEKGEFDE